MSDDGKQACPKIGCATRVARGMLACYPHWMSVTPELRRAVNNTWRRFMDDPQAYRAARDAAVADMNADRETGEVR